MRDVEREKEGTCIADFLVGQNLFFVRFRWTAALNLMTNKFGILNFKPVEIFSIYFRSDSKLTSMQEKKTL